MRDKEHLQCIFLAFGMHRLGASGQGMFSLHWSKFQIPMNCENQTEYLYLMCLRGFQYYFLYFCRKGLTWKYYAKKILYFLRQQNILKNLKEYLQRPVDQQSFLEGDYRTLAQ